MERLILGMYGLSKNSEKVSGYRVVSNEQALEIMEKAYSFGINKVDTAPGYGGGNADYLICESRKRGIEFSVIGKVGMDIESAEFKLELIDFHLDCMLDKHGAALEQVLIHSMPRHLLESDMLEQVLERIREKCGLEIMTGVSLACPYDMKLIGSRIRNASIIQTNISWFDLRILKYVEALSRYTVVARSLFASGMIPLLLNHDSAKNRLVEMPQGLKKIYACKEFIKDRDRVSLVSEIIESDNPADVAFSIAEALDMRMEYVIGPLTMLDLDSTIKTNSTKSLTGHHRVRLRELIMEH
uniref:hypothetical protein n=1 Tax=Cyanobium sp. TaxID=2164130 RepID=UPI0040481F1A